MPRLEMTPMATIIVPALNEAGFLPACLESLRAQPEFPRIEVIVVDNGSTDGTPELAERFGASVLRTDLPTIGAQRNAGAELATGPVYGFLDADCTVLPGWINNALSQFENETIVAVGCGLGVPASGTTWVQRSWAFLKRRPGLRPHKVSWLASANLWVRASAFQRVGGFDERLETSEDADLGYRLDEVGDVLYDTSVGVEHHREPRTLWHFFKKEIWHGKGSYDGLRLGRFTLAEVPSLLVPIWYLLGYILLLCGSMYALFSRNATLAVSAVICLAIPPLAYSARAVLTKGHLAGLPQYVTIYTTYFTARSVALIGTIVSITSRGTR